MINWLLAKGLTALLVKLGIKSSIASALVPIALRTFGEARDAIAKAKAEGASDDEAVERAAGIILPPNHPERPNTLEDIFRSGPT